MVEGNGYPFFASEFSDEPEAQPSLYPAATSDGLGYTMSIRDILHRGVNYYPYFPALETEWFSESGLLTLPDEYDPVNQLEYQVTYVPKSPAEIFWPLAGRYAAEEASYRRDVVYPNYLDVPEGARESLSALLHGSPDGSPTLDDFGGPAELWEGMDTVSRFEAVITASSRTAALLDALAVYDPETPAMPENESDFASWFLTEGRGYCVHFATAGALLLRMQGIPARYVTGYTVWLNANGQGEALDSDAHAWVEVYIDGYGWYPVEMTPGYAGGTDGVTLIGSEAEASPDESDVPEEETPEEEPEPPEEESEELPEEAGLPGEEPVEDEPGFIFPWKAVLGVVLALGALAGGYVLSYLPRKLERENEDANRSVICAYRRYSRSLRWGGEPDETMEELGRKAKFSQHILTEEERETAWKSLDASAERVRARLPKQRKFLFPLMKPLL